MTDTSLAQALRACASGIYAAEAATGMLIAHAAWLNRDDFSKFIYPDTTAGTAAIDWDAAVTALTAGEMPSSSDEQKMLRIAASLAGQTPVILGDAITGLDDRNIQILIKAVLHTAGQRQFPSAS
jgi:hypothetical protein